MPSASPFYDPNLSYYQNYQQGPFGAFAQPAAACKPPANKDSLFGLPLNLPFGIPAGPLLNSRFVQAAFAHGFDLCVYKTVRTRAYPSHPWPNVLAVHPQTALQPGKLEPVLTDQNYQLPLSITNSFGVPSLAPKQWQADMAQAVAAAGEGQILIGSFQGTAGNYPIEEDYALAAQLVAQTGVKVLEANLSCPNEGSQQLLCFDIDKVARIAAAIKHRLPGLPLILKLAYLPQPLLAQLLARVGKLIDGISAINTVPALPVKADGQAALGEDRPQAGICGAAIRHAGLQMVTQLAQLRAEQDYQFKIIGVGGVSLPEHYQAYRQAGADVVMSATGAMWNPNLARQIRALD